MTPAQDIINFIDGYWNPASHTSGLQGFINALTARESVDTPFGDAVLITDGHRLGIVGHHVWITKVGDITFRIKVPYELNGIDGLPWSEAEITETEDFPVDQFPEYPVTLHTSSILIVNQFDKN